MKKLIFYTDKEVKAERFLESLGFSRSVVTDLKKYRFGLVAGGKEFKTSDVLEAGAEVTVTLPEPPPVFSGRLPVLYEDGDFIAVLKPSDMPVHPSSGHRDGGTLRDEFSGVFRPLYRLDKDTEGIVIVAKNAYAARVKNGLRKVYFGVCEGAPGDEGVIDLPIEDVGTVGRVISEGGKRAVTRYKKLCGREGLALLAFSLETGRTHQIRVHTSAAGFPLLGDGLYGNATEEYPHQLLFLGEVALPTEEGVKILKAPLPEAFRKLFPDYRF